MTATVQPGGIRPGGIPPAATNALLITQREELGKMAVQVAVYRQALLDAGIEPPDKTGQELLDLWRDSAEVIDAASELVARLGTSKELLSGRWRT